MTPPLRARLHWYKLTGEEFLVLTAMCEHRSDGSIIWASISRLAAYSKLAERTVQRRIRDLCARGILSQLASGKHKPSSYRINEQAFEDDPRMAPYRSTGQESLPGIPLAPVPGEPIPDDFHKGVSLTPGGVCQTPHSRFTLPPLENFLSREKAKADRAVLSVEKYDPSIGLQIDFRKLCKARDELNLRGGGTFEHQCALAGLTVARGLEVEEKAMRWPEGWESPS